MKLSDTLGLAMQNVRRTRLRTTLSALGVAIGTAAVVTLVAAGNGFQNIAVDRASRFGSLTQVVVYPQQPNRSPQPLTPSVINGFRAMPHVASIDLQLLTPSIRVTLAGTTADLPSSGRSPVDAGGGLVSRATPMPADGVLLPLSFVKRAGQNADAIAGQPITLIAGSSVCCASAGGTLSVLGPDHSFPAHIAGVYDDSAGASSHTGEKAALSDVYLSAELGATIDGTFSGVTGEQYLQNQGYSMAIVTADDARQTATIAAAIKAEQFVVQDRADLLTQVQLVFTIITAGLAAVGSIALLVAAIGIANTMIMTVLERTREIGIMKALGAEPGSVRMLFLAESAMVGLLGGLSGLVLAAAAALVGNVAFSHYVTGRNPGFTVGNLFVVSPLLIVTGLALAIGVALVGGALPSRRAVKLQPLDALRYE